MIEEGVGHDLLMTICRLGDPADTRGFENLTFAKLAQKLPNDTKLGDLVKDYQDKTEAFRTRRNKLYAHSDLESRIGSAPVPQVHKNDLGTACKAAEAIINHVAQNYLGHTQGFGFPADAEAHSPPSRCATVRTLERDSGLVSGLGSPHLDSRVISDN